MSAVCARSSISWPLEIDDSQIRARARSAASICSGLTYRWCASSSLNAAQTSLQWSLSAGASSSSAATSSCVSGAEQVEQRAEALDRQQLGDVRAVRLLLQGGDLRQLAVLGRELGRGRDLDLLDIPERALRERREPPQRLDLHVEHVDPHRALLGGGEHVQQTAAQRELPALLDLLDAFVAGRDELRGAFVEVEQLAHAQRERVRAQRRVGHLLRERHRARPRPRAARLARVRSLLRQQRVERRHAQADEMRRRREVRLVGDAPRGVVAHAPRRQPGAQVRGHVARRAVVADDHERRPRPLGGPAVRERGDRVGPQRGGDERVAALARQALCRCVFLDQPQQRAQRHLSTRALPRAPARPPPPHARSGRRPRLCSDASAPARSPRRSPDRCCSAGPRRPCTRAKSAPPSSCLIDFSPLCPASPPPTRVRTSPNGRSISSCTTSTRSSGSLNEPRAGPTERPASFM